MTVNAKKKENMHNKTCVKESEIENFKKTREIRRRSTAENRILRKFSKITDSVCSDVNVAKELYEGAISDWEVLDIRYPRTQSRKVATSSNKKLFSYMESYENFMQANF